MSNLLKQALTKGKPPKPEEEPVKSDDSDEEEKDTFEDPTAKNAVHKELSNFGSGPIRAFGMPPITKPKSSDPNAISTSGASKQKSKENSPLKWSDYYDTMEYMDNGTPVYTAGTEGPLFFCLHGAGDSAQSFACLAKEIKQFGSLVAFDFRGHGDSKIASSDDLSIETLISDAREVFEYVLAKHPDLCVVIVGHSMGGSAAAKFTEKLIAEGKHKDALQGLVVIDVVEGTAIEALPFMETIVSSRPRKFDSIESVISWHVRTNQVRNMESARVSAPPKVREAIGENGKVHYEWKVDLMQSEKHWMSWFKGLTGSFLGIHMPKLLMLAEKDRMDKDLTIAQMQGKFKLVVIQGVGHYMQEDNFKKTAYNLHQFLSNFRIPATKEDNNVCKQHGIGNFHPVLKPYNMTGL